MPWTNDQLYAMVNKPQPEEIRLVDLINKPDPEEIYHHGIKGQKWGIRRYQNPDGSLTPDGKKRYSKEFYKELKSNKNDAEKIAEITRKRIGERISQEQLNKLKASEDKFKSNTLRDSRFDPEFEEIVGNIIYQTKRKITPDDYKRIKAQYLDEEKKFLSKSGLKKEDIEKKMKNISDGLDESYRTDVKSEDAQYAIFDAMDRDKKFRKIYWDEIKKAKDDYNKRYKQDQIKYESALKELSETKKEIIEDVLGKYSHKKLDFIYDKYNLTELLSGSDPRVGWWFSSLNIDKK